MNLKRAIHVVERRIEHIERILKVGERESSQSSWMRAELEALRLLVERAQNKGGHRFGCAPVTACVEHGLTWRPGCTALARVEPSEER